VILMFVTSWFHYMRNS